jgi:hypothetical protein
MRKPFQTQLAIHFCHPALGKQKALKDIEGEVLTALIMGLWIK